MTLTTLLSRQRRYGCDQAVSESRGVVASVGRVSGPRGAATVQTWGIQWLCQVGTVLDAGGLHDPPHGDDADRGSQDAVP
jgi:hypothetical protein